MLQINSGKLFTRPVGRTNHLRGVLFSNLQLYSRDIVTEAGTLRMTDGLNGSSAIVYELEERIEQQEPDILISHTISPFLQDFSALATFGLKAVVSPDPTLVKLLCSTNPGLSSYHAPREFVSRFFEDRLHPSDEDAEAFAEFTAKLIALDRRTFLAVMQAIRTFVSGLFRLRDDLALAYTLFVSAVESLAQAFDGYETQWTDIDARKQASVDDALKGSAAATARKVREAIVAAEHPSLARRYRAFVIDHIGRDYFRELAAGRSHPIARHQLDAALRQAYSIRSRYVHNLRGLPDDLTLPHGTWEVANVGRVPTLTFEGLVRLTYHVIRTFVERAPSIEREPYNYSREESGTRMVMLAPEYWIAQPLPRPKDARIRLEGLLEQMMPVLEQSPDAKITDIRPIYPDIERHLASGPKTHKPALLALYALFAGLLGDDYRSPTLAIELDRLRTIFDSPSSEALIMRLLFEQMEDWPLKDHCAALDTHLSMRSKPNGLQTPRILDAGLCVALAERYRLAGDIKEARLRLGDAVECCPANSVLIEMERHFRRNRRLSWQALLMPKAEQKKALRKPRTT